MTELNWTECLNYKDCWEDAVNLSPSLSIDLISSARLHFKAFFPLPSVSMGFPCGSAGKESACNVGGLGLIPGLGRSTGEGNGYPPSILIWRIPWTVEPGRLQPMRLQSQTQLSDFHFNFCHVRIRTILCLPSNVYAFNFLFCLIMLA